MRIPLKIILGILLLVPACARDDDRARAASEDRAAEMNDEMKRQRDDYVRAAEAKLDEFDHKFDGLDARVPAMTGTTKDDFEDAVERLREQRKGVGTKLNDLKEVSISSWMTMRSDVDSALAELERSYQQVSTTFDNAHPAKPSTVPR